ncbi:MAG TPA: hypothetical protein VFS08_10170 [Gemmatimonadaceae bacterium]|nr:hypothetical protein [Gemmatimonadaceae bacterium]
MMELLTTAEFLAWAATHGIGYDPRYPRSGSLVFLAALDAWRTWEPPADVGELAWFVDLVLRTAAGDQDLFLFPRHAGHWYTGGRARPWANDALDVIVRGAGIPSGFVGAARCGPGERAPGTALAVGSLIFGWETSQDLFIIPEAATCILMIDHHRQVLGAFRVMAARDAFSATLVAAGYLDPEADEETGLAGPAI